MAQKQYGDVVKFTHNIQELVTNEQGARVRVNSVKTSNAFVISSSVHEGREQLQILYLDESYNRSFLSGSDVQNAIKTAFAFPLVDSAFKGTPAATGQPTIPGPAPAQGWQEAEIITEDQIDEAVEGTKVEYRQLIQAGDKRADALQEQVDELTAELDKFKALLAAYTIEVGGVGGTYDPEGGAYFQGQAVQPSPEAKLQILISENERLHKELNQKPALAPNAKTDDEVYEAVKASLLANGQIAVPDGASLDQVVSAVNRFLKEQSEQK